MKIFQNTWSQINKLLQTTFTKKLEKVYKYFNITKAPTFKE